LYLPFETTPFVDIIIAFCKANVNQFLYLPKTVFIVAGGDSFPAENAEPIAKNKIRIKPLQLRSYSS